MKHTKYAEIVKADAMVQAELGIVTKDKLSGSYQQFCLFQENICWVDIVGFLLEKLSLFNKRLIAAREVDDIARLQGQITEIRQLIDLPRIIAEELKRETKNETTITK